jgi:hypothetical protein
MPVRCNRRIFLTSSTYAPDHLPRICCHMPNLTFLQLRTRHADLASCRPHLSSLIVIHLGHAVISTFARSPLRLCNPNLFRSTVPSLHRFAPPRTYSSSPTTLSFLSRTRSTHLVYRHMRIPTSLSSTLVARPSPYLFEYLFLSVL